MNGFAFIVFSILAAGLIILLFNGNDGTIGPMSDEQFARTIKLGLLGTVLAAGLFTSGQRFGAVARQAAIWLALIIMLVIGYEYRYELQDSVSRVGAVLLPGQPISTEDAEGRTSVTVNRLGRHFVAAGSVNGSDQRFLVDTGATTVVLTEASARDAGYDTGSLNFVIPVSTANGMARAARIDGVTITIGDISRSGLIALVARDNALQSNLLGMNFLDTLTSFEVRRDKLVLRD